MPLPSVMKMLTKYGTALLVAVTCGLTFIYGECALADTEIINFQSPDASPYAQFIGGADYWLQGFSTTTESTITKIGFWTEAQDNPPEQIIVNFIITDDSYNILSTTEWDFTPTSTDYSYTEITLDIPLSINASTQYYWGFDLPSVGESNVGLKYSDGNSVTYDNGILEIYSGGWIDLSPADFNFVLFASEPEPEPETSATDTALLTSIKQSAQEIVFALGIIIFALMGFGTYTLSKKVDKLYE